MMVQAVWDEENPPNTVSDMYLMLDVAVDAVRMVEAGLALCDHPLIRDAEAVEELMCSLLRRLDTANETFIKQIPT